ncbi:hypothetical protein KUTeg_003307 [Tegillarca granosa]|uniref:Uncharacterized protein n=1 Tax=Tegillarca granosa TaxID=220873 RepID=A0ABQ9FLQ7_TEGGR|nr:hypothetical protein KUTeg_003307 [Tegillarca granosa]
MDDDFESQFADELDALDDFEQVTTLPHYQCKIKPCKAILAENVTPVSGKGRPEKRSRSNGYISDEENQELPQLDLLEDDFEVSPPPSPDHLVDKIINQRTKKPQQITEGYHGILMDGEPYLCALCQVDIENMYQYSILPDYDYERRRVHHRIPSGDFVSTTGTEGERGYLPLNSTWRKAFALLQG